MSFSLGVFSSGDGGSGTLAKRQQSEKRQTSVETQPTKDPWKSAAKTSLLGSLTTESQPTDRRPTPQRKARYWLAAIFIILLVMVVMTMVLLLRQDTGISSLTTGVDFETFGLVEPDWCRNVLEMFSGNTLLTAGTTCTILDATDFAVGTYLMDVPGACYVLGEDVDFAPNPNHDHMPRPEQSQYDTPAFRLGFFAAVVIRAPGVTFDLGGHTLRQSVTHRLQQRFFAVIELATPFVPGQGPADFGPLPPLETADCTLRNGRLGRSSHHGIHGNGAWNLLVEDVDLVDYEVAAVALNGVHHVLMRRVRALGSATDVPVLGTYSNARFLMPFVTRALAEAASAPVEAAALTAAANILQALMNQTLADVLAMGRIDAGAHPAAFALFDNPARVVDGNAYGFLFNARGVAVNGFACSRTDENNDFLHDVVVVDSEVRNVRCDVQEVIALQRVLDGAVQRGPVGDVLRIAELFATDAEASYDGHPLADTQLALGAFLKAANLSHNSTHVGTLQIDPIVHAWATGEDIAAIRDAVENGTMRYRRNGDTMFHVNKGAFGVRLDGGVRLALVRVRIDGVVNFGAGGHADPLPGENGTAGSVAYAGAAQGGHPAQDPQAGYMGADSRGVSVAAVSNVWMDACTVENVYSTNGRAYGIDIFNDATGFLSRDCTVRNITQDSNPATLSPATAFRPPHAIGLHTDNDDPTVATLHNFDVHHVFCRIDGASASRSFGEYHNEATAKCSARPQGGVYGSAHPP